jgi:hypothetical protein
MRLEGIAAFVAGVVLAATTSILAQTGPTFPTDPPIIGDDMVRSGSSIEPGKPSPSPTEGSDFNPVPSTDTGDGR